MRTPQLEAEEREKRAAEEERRRAQAAATSASSSSSSSSAPTAALNAMFEPDPNLVAQLKAMGFSENGG